MRCTGGGVQCKFNTLHTSSRRAEALRHTTQNWEKKLMPNFKLKSNFDWMKIKIGR